MKMAIELRVFLLIAIAIYFIVIIAFLKKKMLTLKYTLLWLVTGVVMFALTLFPTIIYSISSLLGIVDPVNAVFAIELFFLLIILMSITAIASKQTERIKHMAQSIALMERRIRELESQRFTAGGYSNGTDDIKEMMKIQVK